MHFKWIESVQYFPHAEKKLKESVIKLSNQTNVYERKIFAFHLIDKQKWLNGQRIREKEIIPWICSIWCRTLHGNLLLMMV